MSAAVVLPPRLLWRPSDGRGDRHGATVRHVVVHRWGDRWPDARGEAAVYHGVVNYLAAGVRNNASAHIVFPGSAVPGEATQLVRWSDYAWAEAAYNPTSDEIESADALWVPDAHGRYDDAGLAVLARIVAFRLWVRGLPAVWSHDRGFCRHADLGSAGGGHTQCPTTDLTRWKLFVRHVQHESARGGFLRRWGR